MLITNGLIATLVPDEPLVEGGALHIKDGIITAVKSTTELTKMYPDDDVLDPDLETRHAQEAAADSQVLAYLGNLYSSGCKIGVPILNRAGVPQISPGATYPGLTKLGFGAGEPGIYYPMGKRSFFRVVTTDDMQGPAGALWAQDLGLTRVYILEQNDIYGRGLARSFRQAAERAGLTILGTSSFADGQTTGLDRIAADVAAVQPDLIYYAGFQTGAVLLIRAVRATGVDAQFMGADGIYTSALITELGDQAEGVMATFTGVPVEELGAVGVDFARRFREHFGREPGGWSVQGYDSMGLALKAIEQAGEGGRAAVLQALRNIEFEGLAGRYTFDENGDTRLLLVSGVYVENGEWQSEGLLRVR